MIASVSLCSLCKCSQWRAHLRATQRQTSTHNHSHFYGPVSNRPHEMFLDCGKKLDNLEGTQQTQENLENMQTPHWKVPRIEPTTFLLLGSSATIVRLDRRNIKAASSSQWSLTRQWELCLGCFSGNTCQSQLLAVAFLFTKNCSTADNKYRQHLCRVEEHKYTIPYKLCGACWQFVCVALLCACVVFVMQHTGAVHVTVPVALCHHAEVN